MESKNRYLSVFFLSLFLSQFSLLFTLFGDAAGHFWFIVLIGLVSWAGALVAGRGGFKGVVVVGARRGERVSSISLTSASECAANDKHTELIQTGDNATHAEIY